MDIYQYTISNNNFLVTRCCMIAYSLYSFFILHKTLKLDTLFCLYRNTMSSQKQRLMQMKVANKNEQDEVICLYSKRMAPK